MPSGSSFGCPWNRFSRVNRRDRRGARNTADRRRAAEVSAKAGADRFEDVASAMMTTDTVMKTAQQQVRLKKGVVHIAA